MKRVPFSAIAGTLLVLMGGTVVLGWWMQLSPVVHVLPEFTPMVFNTALSFALAGCALLLPFSDAHVYRRAATVIGSAIATLTTLVLAEHLLQTDLGIDWPSLHAWLHDANPKPGRMSAGTASAFLMSGAVLIFASRVRRPWMGAAVRLLTLGVGAIGVLGLAGYLVSAPLLFPGYLFAGVAVHTAAGLLLLAVGLWSAWKRFEWGRTPLFAREDDRITFAGATILVAIALVAGIASFAILQGRVQTVVSDSVLTAMTRRIETFQDLIELREVNARIAATRPAVLRNLRVIHAGRDDGSNIANVKAVVDSFLKQGFSGLAYHDIDGKVVASGGAFMQAPAIAVTLATPDKAELLWDKGFLVRHRIPLRDTAGEMGSILAEQPLPVLTRLAQNVLGTSATGDMGLCARQEEQLHCFPQRLNPEVFSTSLVNVAGAPLPMTRALRGETGIVITRDYRAQNVVAAYGPVGDLGLGMVVKIDVAEIFQPIREQLMVAIGLLFLLVAGGTLLLRSQIKPIATKLVDAETQARSQEQRLDFALESAEMGAWELDLIADTSVRSLRHDQIFGYQAPLPEWGAEIFLRHVVAEDREAVKRCFDEAFKTGNFRMECRINRVDECVRWITAEGRVIRNEKGDPVRMVGIVFDITERKNAEEILARRTAELEAANQELEAFSYSVSHDLRAPLRHIDGFSDMLREECGSALDDSGRRHLDVISGSVKQMGKLIDDLLVFSKMGRVEMRQAQVSMDDLVKEVLQELAGDTKGRNIEWDIQLLPGVRGDPSMLKQVWANLLSNSVKYTRPRDLAKIKLGCSKKNGALEFYVQDNGAGFDMKYAEKLFGVFQRLHRAEEFEGTGVGLANVRRIVTRHGGQTRAHGKIDEGAIFYFTLPDSERE